MSTHYYINEVTARTIQIRTHERTDEQTPNRKSDGYTELTASGLKLCWHYLYNKTLHFIFKDWNKAWSPFTLTVQPHTMGPKVHIWCVVYYLYNNSAKIVLLIGIILTIKYSILFFKRLKHGLISLHSHSFPHTIRPTVHISMRLLSLQSYQTVYFNLIK